MKFRHFFLALVAAVTLTGACKEIESDLSFPAISMVQSEDLTFDQTSGSKTISFLANRAWKATSDVDWVAIDPAEGEGSTETQTVTVTVLDNTSWDRTGTVTIDIVYDTQTFPLAQAGKGSPEDKILFFNDFDKEGATQTYGTSGSSWPYLDQFDGWKNQKGKGIEAVTYQFSAISARANSQSNGTYSDYDGSGTNNLLFSTNGYLRVNKIALNGNTDIAMSFGTEKYDNNDKTALFTPTELPFYVSIDGEKWVSLEYTYAGTTAGRWNLASAVFSVPAGTEYMYVHIASKLSGVHRLDDLRLEASEEAGTSIDFSQGIEINAGSGSDSGSGSGSGSEETGTEITCAKALELCNALADGASSTETYTITGYITDVYTTISKNQQSFWMADTQDGGKVIQAYWANLPDGVASFTKGSKVKITGKLLKYVNSSTSAVTPEVKNATVVILEAEGGESGGGSTNPGTGATYKKVTEVTSGRTYIMVASGKAAQGLSKTYGYLSGTDVTDNNGVITLAATNEEFILDETRSGYVIKQYDGKYLYQTGTYNSFNVSDSEVDGCYWYVNPQSDGTFKITNKAVIKYIQYSSQYSSYGSYETENGVMPYLYEKVSDGQGGGSTDPGTGTGKVKTISLNSSAQTWTSVTDAKYGAGYTSTTDGVTISYYKNTASTAPVTAQSDHIRVYKDYWFSISVEGATKITKVVLTCAYADKCFDMTVSDGSTAKADTSAKTVTWTGSLDQFGAQSVGGQNRFKSVTITYE